MIVRPSNIDKGATLSPLSCHVPGLKLCRNLEKIVYLEYKIGSSYFEWSILSEKSKINAQSYRFVGLGTGSILPKSAKLLLEQSSTSHYQSVNTYYIWSL